MRRYEPTAIYRPFGSHKDLCCARCGALFGFGHIESGVNRSVFSIYGDYREREPHFFAPGTRPPRRTAMFTTYVAGLMSPHEDSRPFPAPVSIRVKCAACSTINEVKPLK